MLHCSKPAEGPVHLHVASVGLGASQAAERVLRAKLARVARDRIPAWRGVERASASATTRSSRSGQQPWRRTRVALAFAEF
jgi:hypothetical protein